MKKACFFTQYLNKGQDYRLFTQLSTVFWPHAAMETSPSATAAIMKKLFFISYVFIYLEFIVVLSRFDKLNDRTANPSDTAHR